MQPRLPFDVDVLPTSTSAPSMYFVRHRRARRYVVRVEAAGRVRVTIPRGGSKREAEAFVLRQDAWIRRQLTRVTSVQSVATPAERAEMQVAAATVLPSALHALAARHGLTVARVSIRNQRTRWGSCGRDGHITLNWRLMAMPLWVRDYVIIHELMHLRHLNHSRAYWALVEAAYPAHAEARAWLRLHGPSLL